MLMLLSTIKSNSKNTWLYIFFPHKPTRYRDTRYTIDNIYIICVQFGSPVGEINGLYHYVSETGLKLKKYIEYCIFIRTELSNFKSVLRDGEGVVVLKLKTFY